MTISPPLLGNMGALPLLCSSSHVIPPGLSFVMCKIFCSFLSPLSLAASATPLLPWRENELNVNKWLIPRDETLALRGNPGLIKPRLSRGHIVFLSAVKVRRCNEDKRQEPCGREVTPLSGRNPHWRLWPQGGQSGSLFSSFSPLPPYRPPSTWDYTS